MVFTIITYMHIPNTEGGGNFSPLTVQCAILQMHIQILYGLYCTVFRGQKATNVFNIATLETIRVHRISILIITNSWYYILRSWMHLLSKPLDWWCRAQIPLWSRWGCSWPWWSSPSVSVASHVSQRPPAVLEMRRYTHSYCTQSQLQQK